MNVFEQALNDRDDGRLSAHDRAKAAAAWKLRNQSPEDRLLRFDSWLRAELERRLDWTWAGDAKAKRIDQCRVQVEQLVLQLWRRGWLLDGDQLAGHLIKMLDAVGTYQRAGKVGDFWPYFKAAVNRYVGLNAEEIQHEARRLGTTVGQLLGPLGLKQPAGATLPELVAQRAQEVAQAKAVTLREKLTRKRAQERARKADAEQPKLL